MRLAMAGRFHLLTLIGVLAILAGGSRPTAAQATKDTEAPIVVELFTSEGCSSCPPADSFLKELSSISGVIVLSEHVDYWNREGWTDPFSSSAFTARQQEYARRLGSDVYTPQMVVDGHVQFIGSDRGAAVAALREVAHVEKVKMTVTARVDGPHAAVHVDVAPGNGAAATLPDADVVVALTEDNLSTAVTGGENKGRRIDHTGVTRVLSTAGRTKRGAPLGACDASLSLKSGWMAERLRVVTFLQSRKDGTILGAASVPLGAQRNARLEGR
jgi:hypothetical protein